ncbi:hypothetical protein [Massilia timonae]|jgi:hypothetical protein|uniref:hypothetical protein n=1 Tax=Massilia timonae TaxID=47229 RepID=UPI0016093B9D|nr:hypothetical protein [Massilia timonae]
MNIRFIIASALLGVSATASSQVLSPDGYGKIQFGQRLDQVERKLGQRATPRPLDPSCPIVRFKRYPQVSFMVENGVIVRADARTVVRNSAGVTARMSARDALRQAPAMRSERHKYDEQGQYLILPKGENKALIFEASKGKLTTMRAGIKPAVDYVEMCG